MNQRLQDFARQTIKSDLAKLSPQHHYVFKAMYAPRGRESDMSIDDVVDRLAPDKLDWAMEQVQNTLNKQNRLPGEVERK